MSTERQNNIVDELAKILWNYHRLNHILEKTDCILGLGNHDIRIADYAIDLFQQGWSSMIIFSGGVIHQNKSLGIYWDKPEAEVFAKRAAERGVPPEKILIENQSKNTGQNFQFVAELLESKSLTFNSFIVVQKPYMERRTLATGLKHWPNKKLIIASPTTSFEEYVNGKVPKEQIVSFMVGDLQRIKLYAEKGFQIYQEIPDYVWDAYLKLVDFGFTDRLLKD